MSSEERISQLWALAPEWKTSRTFVSGWREWFFSLWLVGVVARLLGLSHLLGGSSRAVPVVVAGVPPVLSRQAALRPSAWRIAATERKVVVLQPGEAAGMGEASLVTRTARDEFARVTTLSLTPAPFGAEKLSRVVWDAAGRSVAVATGDAVHVVRVKGGGASVLRGTFAKMPLVAGVALVETPRCHFVFALLFDGRMARMTLPAGVNGGLYDWQQGCAVSSLGNDWRPTCMAFCAERSLFVIGGTTAQDGTVALSMYSIAKPVGTAERAVNHEWSSWRETGRSLLSLPKGGVVEVAFSPDGSRAACTCSNGEVLLLECNIQNPSLASVANLLPYVPSSLSWFDDKKVVVASFKLGRLDLVGVVGDDKSVSSLSEGQPMNCSDLSSVSQGRFFLLNFSFREYAATKLTREKILKMQQETLRGATAWGSFLNTLESYVSYFKLPVFNTRRGGLMTRDEFHVTVYFDSFTPEQLTQKKLEEKKWDEALAIARKHKLPADDIFKSRVAALHVLNDESIRENLGSMEDTEWVLAFCLNRVSSDADELRSLCTFALKRCVNDDVRHEAYRVLLEERVDRLDTYLEATGGGGAFDGKDFDDFSKQDVTVAAIAHAMSGNVALVKLLWRRHGEALLPFRFAVLESFPETVSCLEYSEMLPRVHKDTEAEYDMMTTVKKKKERTPASMQLKRGVAEGGIQVTGGWNGFLRALLFPKESVRVLEVVFSPCEFPASADFLSNWFEKRAFSIDHRSGQLTLCTELLSHAVMQVGVDRIGALTSKLAELSSLVYSLGKENLLLQQYAQLDEYHRCALFFQAVDKTNLALVLKLTRTTYFAGRFVEFLKRFLRESSASDTHSKAVELLLVQSAPAVAADVRPFLEVKDLMEAVVEAAYLSNRLDLSLWKHVLERVPARLSHTGQPELEALHDRLDRLDADLEACQLLGRLGQPTPLSKVRGLEFDAVVAGLKKHLHKGSSDWNAVLRDVLALRENMFSDVVPLHAVYAQYLALLTAAKQPLERVLRFAPDCGPLAEPVVAISASEVFDSSNGLDSADLTYVRQLVGEFPDTKMQELLEAADLLNGAQVKMIPLQLRLWKNQTTDDIITRVSAAIVRSDAEPLSGERCRRLCELLHVKDVDSAFLALQFAFVRSDLRRGRVERAVETSVRLKDAEMALQCLEVAKKESDVALLTTVVLKSGKPEHFGAALTKYIEVEREKVPSDGVAAAAVVPAVVFDPLLDEPLPKTKTQQLVEEKKMEEGDPDDIAGIAKKAWSNFFSGQ